MLEPAVIVTGGLRLAYLARSQCDIDDSDRHDPALSKTQSRSDSPKASRGPEAISRDLDARTDHYSANALNSSPTLCLVYHADR